MSIFRKGNSLRTIKGLQYSNFGNAGVQPYAQAIAVQGNYSSSMRDISSSFIFNNYIYTGGSVTSGGYYSTGAAKQSISDKMSLFNQLSSHQYEIGSADRTPIICSNNIDYFFLTIKSRIRKCGLGNPGAYVARYITADTAEIVFEDSVCYNGYVYLVGKNSAKAVLVRVDQATLVSGIAVKGNTGWGSFIQTGGLALQQIGAYIYLIIADDGKLYICKFDESLTLISQTRFAYAGARWYVSATNDGTNLYIRSSNNTETANTSIIKVDIATLTKQAEITLHSPTFAWNTDMMISYGDGRIMIGNAYQTNACIIELDTSLNFIQAKKLEGVTAVNSTGNYRKGMLIYEPIEKLFYLKLDNSGAGVNQAFVIFKKGMTTSTSGIVITNHAEITGSATTLFTQEASTNTFTSTTFSSASNATNSVPSATVSSTVSLIAPLTPDSKLI